MKYDTIMEEARHNMKRLTPLTFHDEKKFLYWLILRKKVLRGLFLFLALITNKSFFIRRNLLLHGNWVERWCFTKMLLELELPLELNIKSTFVSFSLLLSSVKMRISFTEFHCLELTESLKFQCYIMRNISTLRLK